MGNNLTYHTVGKSAESCSGVTNDAGTFVGWYQSKFSNVAIDAIDSLERALTELQEGVSITGQGAEPGALEELGITYTAPANVPKWEYTFESVGDAPSKLPPIDPILTTSVAEPGDVPKKPTNIITDFDPVDPLNAKTPGDAPPVDDITIPLPPTMDDFDDPTKYPINIPDRMEPIVIPEFSGTLPDLNIPLPSGDFTWSEADYDSAILQATQGRIAEFLEGGVGIPDYVWDRIWYRGKDKADKTGSKLVKEITEEYSSKGFSLPQGVQLSRVDQARVESANQINELNRELVIQQSQAEIENLKFAVAQGQAIESLLGGWHENQMGRALDAAKFSYQAEIEIFNAQITFFEAQVSLFRAETEKYKSELEAALAILEQQKIYLEGQKIIADINQIEVNIYEANIKAYQAAIDAYNGYVKGLIAKTENSALKMQAYKTEVDAYGTLVQAKNSEYEGLKTQVEVEQLKIGIFETEVRAYGTEVDAYGSITDAAYKTGQTKQLNNDNAFKKFNSSLELHNIKLKDRLETINAYAQDFDAKVKSYGIGVENKKLVNSTKLDSRKSSIDSAAQATAANIASAGNYTQAAINEAQLLKSTSDILSKAYAQVAASAMSVVHVSAGLSDTTNNSARCSTTFDGGNV